MLLLDFRQQKVTNLFLLQLKKATVRNALNLNITNRDHTIICDVLAMSHTYAGYTYTMVLNELFIS